MDEMAVSKFKATCLAALERVRATGRPLRVTRFGKPLAEVIPVQATSRGAAWLGAMRGRGRLGDDLISPAEGSGAWDALA
jgi:antitoxin (DNA-binding transcriptional repressor) of toxin-antitoxin stability system